MLKTKTNINETVNFEMRRYIFISCQITKQIIFGYTLIVLVTNQLLAIAHKSNASPDDSRKGTRYFCYYSFFRNHARSAALRQAAVLRFYFDRHAKKGVYCNGLFLDRADLFQTGNSLGNIGFNVIPVAVKA